MRGYVVVAMWLVYRGYAIDFDGILWFVKIKFYTNKCPPTSCGCNIVVIVVR